MRPVTGHAPGYFTRPRMKRPARRMVRRRRLPAHHSARRRLHPRSHVIRPGGVAATTAALPLARQALGTVGVPAAGVGAALAVDALISKIDNPILTAAIAPVFLGTAAIEGAVSVLGDVGDALFGGPDLSWMSKPVVETRRDQRRM